MFVANQCRKLFKMDEEIEIVDEIINNPHGFLIPLHFIAENPGFFGNLGQHHLEPDEDQQDQVADFNHPGHPIWGLPQHVPLDEINAEAIQFLMITVDRIDVRTNQIFHRLAQIQVQIHESTVKRWIKFFFAPLSRLMNRGLIRLRQILRNL